MARKGSQGKSVNHSAKAKFVIDDKIQEAQRGVNGEEVMDSSVKGSRKRKHKTVKNSFCEKLDEKAVAAHDGNPMETHRLDDDLVSSASVFDNGEDKIFLQSNQVHPLSSATELPEQLPEKHGYSESAFVLYLKALVISLMKEAANWLERLRPHLATLKTAVLNGHNYVRLKLVYACPIISTWLSHAGRIVLVLAMVWLDCSIRGLDSLLRLGTTSYFVIFWCCILSISGMIGLTKMLALAVIAVIVAFFLSLGLGLLILAISALVILWLYGSFWTTAAVLVVGGVSFMLKHERFGLLLTSVYSVYSAASYVGWAGLLLGLNLSIFSSDVLIHILKSAVDEQKFRESSRHFEQAQGSASSEDVRMENRGPGDPSTSGSEKELTSEDEIIRLLNCTNHYEALGFRCYESVDVALLKKEYRKKAMLVHPDKNMGNEKAADAFKKLQNAYEVLLDSLKRKTYDDELRREELLTYFRRFQTPTSKKGRYGTSRSGLNHHNGVDEGPNGGESRQIACKRCGGSHLWIATVRLKSQARWCQDCKEFHQAKDGDGWLEQSFQPLLFGLFRKMDEPCAYVCAESRIYDATEWFLCQGMRCLANTHKPSFHVNASLVRQSSRGGGSVHRAGGGMPGATAANFDETMMTEEEFFEWLQNAMHSSVFESNDGAGASASNSATTSQSSGGGGSAKSSFKKKRKGKKQW